MSTFAMYYTRAEAALKSVDCFKFEIIILKIRSDSKNYICWFFI
jgi:hypothetical protein